MLANSFNNSYVNSNTTVDPGNSKKIIKFENVTFNQILVYNYQPVRAENCNTLNS